MPKILILGYGRHGKDTVADILRDSYGFKIANSSRFVGEKAVWPFMKDQYSSFEECYNDRHKRRTEWHDLIKDYNTPDRARLGKEIFAENDVYVGLRNIEEFEAIHLAVKPIVVWIEREGFTEESISSCSVHQGLADFTIYNNGTIQDLHGKVKALIGNIYLFK